MPVHPGIQAGDQAVGWRDWATAEAKYRLALEDATSNEITKRIAQNRLADLSERRVYGCQSTRRYHRVKTCGAWSAAINPIWYEVWKDAEAAGMVPCPHCHPQQLFRNLL